METRPPQEPPPAIGPAQGKDTDSESILNGESDADSDDTSQPTDWGEEELVQRIWNILPHAPPFADNRDPREEQIRKIVQRSIKQGLPAYGRQEAIEEGGNFRISRERIARDEKLITIHGGMEKAAIENHKKKLENNERMTKEKVRRTVSEGNPEKGKLLAMCAEENGGVQVLRPPGFEPNGMNPMNRPQVSGKTKEVAGALHKIFNKTYVQPDLCFAVSTEFALKMEPKTHISPSSHGLNDGKKLGRGCVNNTAGGRPPCQPLNSDWLREAAKLEHGPIENPQIKHLVKLITKLRKKLQEEGREREEIRLWKLDIKGAYTQLTFRAEDVRYMGAELPGEVVLFFMGGTFGWSAMPFAFNVVTRAIVWEIANGLIRGFAAMYVDDVWGASAETDTGHDMEAVKSMVEGLFCKGAIATDKTEVDTQQGTIGQLDGIGYTVDRIANRVGISARNKAKAFSAVWSIGDGRGTRLKAVQRIASHGSRYKAVVPMMAPFTRALHAACKGHRHQHATFDLTRETMAAVWMMRVLLVLSEVMDRDFTRSFESFELRDRKPTWVIEYDASLRGLAVIWFKIKPDGAEVAVGCGAIDLRHKGYENSGLMNTLELMAATVGLWKLKERGVRGAAVRVRGDNMTAMEWAENKGFRSEYARKTAIAFMATSVEAGLEVVEKVHLPHTKKYDNNWRTDKPSRHQMNWDEVRKEEKRDKITGSRLGEEMEE